MPDHDENRLRFIGWGITERCNLSCPHCYSSATGQSTDELSTAECLTIVDQLAALGVEIIGWTGGEPLMRKDLEEIMAYAHRTAGIISGITTNGVPLNRKRAESLKDAGVRFIQVSIDGPTAEKNGIMRAATEKDFRRAVDGIRIAQSLGLKVHLAMLLGKENLADARDFVDFAAELQVASVRFCGFVPWGRGKDSTVNDRLNLLGRLDELRRLVEQLQYRSSPVVMFDPALGPLPPDFRYHECVSGIETLYISANGDVFPCTALLDDEFKVGNLREKSLRELLHDPNMRRVSAHPRDNITGACRECGNFSVCRGACRGITYAYTGDLNASCPLCLCRVEHQKVPDPTAHRGIVTE